MATSTAKMDRLPLLKTMPPMSRYIFISNVHGISNEKTWSDEETADYTYFMLPILPRQSIMFGIRKKVLINNVKIDPADFVRFWHQLDDIHKERRLLVNYMCSLRGIADYAHKNMDFVPERSTVALAMDAILRYKVLSEMALEIFWSLRSLLIEKQHNEGHGGFLDVMTAALLMNSSDEAAFDFLHRYHYETVGVALAQTDKSKHFAYGVIICAASKFLHCTVAGLTETYMGWKSIPETPEMKKSPRQRYLDKLKVAAPHWRSKDRSKVSDVLADANQEEDNEDGWEDADNDDDEDLDDYEGPYMERLLTIYGKEKFKLIAFGKEYFCANCGQSSHTSKDRLLTCKRCDKEGVRHKARYCNIDCHKAHWSQHKAEVHPIECCHYCGKKAVDQIELQSCKRCVDKGIQGPGRYCSMACQKTHWPEHKMEKHSSKAAAKK